MFHTSNHNSSIRAGGRAALAVATVGLAAFAFVASPATSSAQTTPDPTVAGGWQVRYEDCMKKAATTPDALEHWVAPCRQRATLGGTVEEATYRSCIISAGTSPDRLESLVEACRQQSTIG